MAEKLPNFLHCEISTVNIPNQAAQVCINYKDFLIYIAGNTDRVAISQIPKSLIQVASPGHFLSEKY